MAEYLVAEGKAPNKLDAMAYLYNEKHGTTSDAVLESAPLGLGHEVKALLSTVAESVVRLRDSANRANSWFARVEEIFGAVANQVAESEREYASSVHGLVVDEVRHRLDDIVGFLNIYSDEDRDDMDYDSALYESLTAEEVLGYLDVDVDAVREYSLGIDRRNISRWQSELDQEFFRAWVCFYPPGSQHETISDEERKEIEESKKKWFIPTPLQNAILKALKGKVKWSPRTGQSDKV